MSQRARMLIAVSAIIVIAGGIVAIDLIRRATSEGPTTASGTELPPGAIPMVLDGAVIAGFTPDDLRVLDKYRFIDDEEGKEQCCWLLRDGLLLHLNEDQLAPDTAITVSSSSRNKTIRLTWAEIADADNMVLLDLSGRGTLKLVSRGIEALDVRDEWIQDIDKIEIDTTGHSP
jgi:hypothetical protein